MSRLALHHHKKAASHHEQAAKHHRQASQHHEAGDHKRAAHHAQAARGHALHANDYADDISREHAARSVGDDSAWNDNAFPSFDDRSSRERHHAGDEDGGWSYGMSHDTDDEDIESGMSLGRGRRVAGKNASAKNGKASAAARGRRSGGRQAGGRQARAA